MILRKLAQGLLRQDWGTVFLEIAVVVVGLFLGLELNNWTADQQDQERLQTYYRQLIIDLRADIFFGKLTTEAAESADALVDIVWRVTRGDDVADIPDDLLVRATITAGYSFRPTATTQTYDELISTGQVRLIPDLELKRALGGYYYSMVATGSQWDSLIQHEQTNYRDAIRGLFTPDHMRWIRRNIRTTETALPALDRDELLRKMRARDNLADAAAAMAAVHTRLQGRGRSMSEGAETLLKQVEAQLDN